MTEILEKIKTDITGEMISYLLIAIIGLILLGVLAFLKNKDRAKKENAGVAEDKKTEMKGALSSRGMTRAAIKLLLVIGGVIFVCFLFDRTEKLIKITNDLNNSAFVTVNGEFEISYEHERERFIRYTDENETEITLVIYGDSFDEEYELIEKNSSSKMFRAEITYSEESHYILAIIPNISDSDEIIETDASGIKTTEAEK